MSKKKSSQSKPSGKSGQFAPQKGGGGGRSTPMSRRPPRQPGR